MARRVRRTADNVPQTCHEIRGSFFWLFGFVLETLRIRNTLTFGSSNPFTFRESIHRLVIGVTAIVSGLISDVLRAACFAESVQRQSGWTVAKVGKVLLRRNRTPVLLKGNDIELGMVISLPKPADAD